VRGAADLLVDGQLYPWPFRAERVADSTLLTAEDKAALQRYIEDLKGEQPEGFQADLLYDDHSAEEEFVPLGPRVVDYVMRSAFEGPFFTRLNTLSAAMVRRWLRALQDSTFFQVDAGMDAPWLRLARELKVQLGEPVETLRVTAPGVEVVTKSGGRRYDGVVLAVPAPAAAKIMAGQPEYGPPWLNQVEYSAQVRLYAARRTTEDAQFGVHLIPPQTVFSVEHYSGRHGAWGSCPADWQWSLICAYGPASGPLLDAPEEEVKRVLWDCGIETSPNLFSLAEADAVHLMRWRWAVPIMAPGHYRRLAEYQNRPPVVFAGDWMREACVEGAVRSGEVAAAAFGA
jgi:protoporphyrinogen oxidase